VPAVERRPAVAGDEPFLRELYASTRPEVADWPDEARTAFLAHQFEAQRTGWSTSFPGSDHDVIVLGEQPVGRVWVHWSDGQCLIVDLALLPEHRRQGIGTQIVEEVLAAANRVGVPVRAHVERMNTPSLAFWTRLGFRERAGDALFIEIERPYEEGSSS
jgi:GNAT superfamily N-acetyltransferase